jgi:hypothetical protein
MYSVFYACAKINMRPNSSLANGYSPMEVFQGRSVSNDRDLGGRLGQEPIPFGSRCEIFEGTTNTVADRTRPAIWLESKGTLMEADGIKGAVEDAAVGSRNHHPYEPGGC